MSISITANGIQYQNALQTDARPVIKHRITSASTLDQGLPTGSWDFLNGSEINMGVPEKSNNWYRCEFYTCIDDQGNNNGGCGFALYRYTPSSGWNQILAQGWHANYDNNLSDMYTTTNALWLAPVHTSYPNEEHRFRVYGRRHPDESFRVNTNIGADLRRDGWVNNLFEVYEMDGDIIDVNGLTRY